MLKNEIVAIAQRMGRDELTKRLFKGMEVSPRERDSLLTSFLSGHHILILGPPGCGKTTLANRIGGMLGPLEVVIGCPMNCSPEAPSCPWCAEAKAKGKKVESRTITGPARVKRVQGSGGVVPEDLIGDLKPEVALIHGIHYIGAFLPGKLLRANRGILLIDFIDRIPDRVLNTILYALRGGSITIGPYEEKLTLDILVVATGSERTLHHLPLELIDYFDVLCLDYVANPMLEKQVVLDYLGQNLRDKTSTGEAIDRALDIVNRTRTHHEIQRGVSTRGAIKYAELLLSMNSLPDIKVENIIRTGARISLPHRLQTSIEFDSPSKGEQIVEDILDGILGSKQVGEDLITLSKEDIIALVEEIAKEDKFRKPLKYGAFELLLRRIQRFPESKLAQTHRQAMEHLEGYYPELRGSENVTPERLAEIERVRKREEKLSKEAAGLEIEALRKTLNFLEDQDILKRSRIGWELSRKGLSFLLERLMPGYEGKNHLYSYGKHSTGRKSVTGEGKIIGTRQFRFGDRFQDISLKSTIREAIRNHRLEIAKEDIRVAVKDIYSRMDIVLVLDLSGTMEQLEKLWCAKESAIALALAAMRYRDRIGLVTFSNQAEVVVDLTRSVYKLARHAIDLDLHEKAFTNIGNGLMKAYQLFSRHPKGNSGRHIILISDGDATAPYPSPQRFALRQAAQVERKGITISCICINEESADPGLMGKIARIGKGRIYLVGHEGLTTALLAERETLNDSV